MCRNTATILQLKRSLLKDASGKDNRPISMNMASKDLQKTNENESNMTTRSLPPDKTKPYVERVQHRLKP